MAYIVIQGTKGFVSLVEKGRVRQGDGSNPVCTIRGICGLGNMTKAEFHAFKDWAHSFKDQSERKAMVLSSGKAIQTKEKTIKEVADHKQVKTTVKRPPQQKKVKSKITILDKAKHWKILEKEKRLELEDIALEKRELREKNKKIVEKPFDYPKGLTIKGKKEYLKIHEKTIKAQIKELQDEKYVVGQAKACSGLYGVRREKANLIKIDSDLKVCDTELKSIEKERGKL